jgi:hypothetical protein
MFSSIEYLKIVYSAPANQGSSGKSSFLRFCLLKAIAAQ